MQNFNARNECVNFSQKTFKKKEIIKVRSVKLLIKGVNLPSFYLLKIPVLSDSLGTRQIFRIPWDALNPSENENIFQHRKKH